MTKKRRHFLQAVGLAWACALMLPSLASAAPTVDVVKIMSFSCPVCRAAEAQDVAIESAVKAVGGSFVRGPVPVDPAESGAKERVYYAARGVSPAVADTIKNAIYRGAQDLSIPLGEENQVLVWLQQQLGDMPEKDLTALFEASRGPRGKGALSRAATLAVSVGVESLPAYVIVVDGRPVSSVDPTSVPGGSLTRLRDEVISKVKTLAK
ncbi:MULTISPECIES: hypothetical protein [unclassified Variovorax]|uniref:hypothetical protein n=1 Tax=unclassified Variovorax TaxID=663243 RepID=UPI00076C33DE|nr:MULTISPECIES: hypothetical protein [unclassified Variovorax]KWT98332.1 hypothetical protein APY03_0467 [Variovorax sp. WDL1]PNG50012.1 hypothetical protein CHC06_05593 [Variovorax sp. B2]PNG50884.1 hypothetical protein CHC07_05498 [Variovorax sp. B4]VTU41464.1 hypothetical protein SRS16P1_00006 [Variovorax sp. SRS16]VTU41491.1 hypothetical protein E5P1_00006 [Variovorax sp. PBL-E5]